MANICSNMRDRPPIRELLEVAERAVRAAGAIILENLGCANRPPPASPDGTTGRDSDRSGPVAEVKANLKDVVTEYDRRAQEAVTGLVLGAYPRHSFLGEEDVAAGSRASAQALADRLRAPQRTARDGGPVNNDHNNVDDEDFLWICDPIDGTSNFASGLPLCGVTLALVHRGAPYLGMVYDPHRDDLFAAVRGRGATRNGETIHVTRSVSSLRDAIVNVGCPADPSAFAASVRGLLALNGACRGLRVVACAAMTLPWIACGRLAGHFGYDLSSWDLVAGALLVHEAGGRVTDLDGSPYRLETRNMLCSNGLVHDEILRILEEADAVSYERAD